MGSQMPVDVTEAFLFEQLGRSAAAEKALSTENGQLRAENNQLRSRLAALEAQMQEAAQTEPPKAARK